MGRLRTTDAKFGLSQTKSVEQSFRRWRSLGGVRGGAPRTKFELFDDSEYLSALVSGYPLESATGRTSGRDNLEMIYSNYWFEKRLKSTLYIY